MRHGRTTLIGALLLLVMGAVVGTTLREPEARAAQDVGQLAVGPVDTFGPFELAMPWPAETNAYSVPKFWEGDNGERRLTRVEIGVEAERYCGGRFTCYSNSGCNPARYSIRPFYWVMIDMDGLAASEPFDALALWGQESYIISTAMEDNEVSPDYEAVVDDDVTWLSLSGNVGMWIADFSGQTLKLPVAEAAANTATVSGSGGVSVFAHEASGRFWVRFHWEEVSGAAASAPLQRDRRDRSTPNWHYTSAEAKRSVDHMISNFDWVGTIRSE